MAEKIVREIYNPDRTRRVLIVQRDGGSFGFEEEHFSEEPLEKCWIRESQKPFSICDSPEIALKEATGRIAWLASSQT